MHLEQNAKCIDCKQWFLYHRPAYQGRVRCLCDKCKKAHTRRMTKERVRKLREKRIKVTKANKRFIVHVHKPQSMKTYCGAKQDDQLVMRILIGAGECDWRHCRTCAMMFKKATGSELAQ